MMRVRQITTNIGDKNANAMDENATSKRRFILDEAAEGEGTKAVTVALDSGSSTLLDPTWRSISRNRGAVKVEEDQIEFAAIQSGTFPATAARPPQASLPSNFGRSHARDTVNAEADWTSRL